jgi:serine protease Do
MYHDNQNNNMENHIESPYDSANIPSAAENAANGNFSDDPTIVTENSVSRNQQPEITYCAESVPNTGDSQRNNYSTSYYAVNANTQTAGSGTNPEQQPSEQKTSAYSSRPGGMGTIPGNVNSDPGLQYRTVHRNAGQDNSENNQNVKKITKNRMSGAMKGLVISCICLSLILGIAAGSLISSYVFRSSYKDSDGSDSQGSQSIGSNISPDKNSSGNSTSGFLTYAIEDKDTSPLSTAEIAAKCGVSVVEIRTETVTTGKWMQEYITEGAGSGVILTQDGYIVTNNHVIENANKIKVTLQDGTDYDAVLIGTDEKSDIALIKIEASNLTPASVGDSDKLVVGEKAVAIGNPLGELGGTVTDGIISALDREVTIDGIKMSLLQTNAAINPGNSGGGLFNGAGNLIAIVDAKSSGEGIEGLGFAIPVNDMAAVVQQLMDYGYVKGYTDTGMTFIDITDTLTAMQYRVNSLGVYVLKVSGENALDAGFQSGDLVTKVDGQEVSTSGDIDTVISAHSVGDQIEFEVYRSRGDLTLTLTLTEYVPESSNA